MAYVSKTKETKQQKISIPKFNKIERVEEYLTDGIKQDIIITDAKYFSSFSDGTTQLNGIDILKNQPYFRPLLSIGIYEPFIFNDRGNKARLTIIY